MSFIGAIEKDFKSVGSFLSAVVSDIKHVAALWALIQNNGTKALILKISSDVLTVVNEAEAAAGAGGMNFVLDEEVFNSAKALIADAKAGKGTIEADLAALGIKFPTAAPAAPAVQPVAVAAAPAPAPEVYGMAVAQ